MGEDVPDEFPVFDPDKWYCIHVAGYWAGAGGCELWAWNTSCCRKGDTINLWLGFECVMGFGTCTIPTALAAQKLISTDGPFDDAGGCVGVGCGPG